MEVSKDFAEEFTKIKIDLKDKEVLDSVFNKLEKNFKNVIITVEENEEHEIEVEESKKEETQEQQTSEEEKTQYLNKAEINAIKKELEYTSKWGSIKKGGKNHEKQNN